MIDNFYVDLTTLGAGYTGVSVYAHNLTNHLEETFKCKVLVPPYLAANFKNAIVCPEPIYFKRGLVGRRPLWRKHANIRTDRNNFFYAPHMHGIIGNCKQVLTIHDIIAYRSKTRNVIDNAFNYYVLPHIVRNAVGIITVSKTSRKEIAHHFKVSESKIEIVTNGIDLTRWAPTTLKSSLEPAYLLVVSANRPYKNVVELLNNHYLWSNTYRLKIVSSSTRYGRTLRQTVSALDLNHIVDFIDNVPEHALIQLYQHCAAVIYPSLLEGFGRPALESIAVGKPVILSDIAVHREIFNGSAIFITPGSIDSWRAAFQYLHCEGEVAKLIATGRDMLQKFSWNQVALSLTQALLRFEPQLSNLLRNQ